MHVSDYAGHLAAALGSTPDSATTMANVYQQVITQGTLLTYLEDFKVLGLVFRAMLPLLLLVKSVPRGAAPAAAPALH